MDQFSRYHLQNSSLHESHETMSDSLKSIPYFFHFLIPMWAFLYLLFLYQLLRTTWGEEPISPKLLRGLWSAFTITVFIAKLFWEGLSFGILSNFFAMFYIVFLFSSGFAIGFIGTSNIALKHALEEITRIGKRYTGVTISQ